jgi:hypothetical protein
LNGTIVELNVATDLKFVDPTMRVEVRSARIPALMARSLKLTLRRRSLLLVLYFIGVYSLVKEPDPHGDGFGKREVTSFVVRGNSPGGLGWALRTNALETSGLYYEGSLGGPGIWNNEESCRFR